MKRIALCLTLMLLVCFALTATAEKPGDVVTITFTLTDNSQSAISARVGMEFDSNAFEFVSAEVISSDVLNAAPTTANGKFGLLNMAGISVGEIGTITLRIKEDAPAGKYEVRPVVDSVYNANRETVELSVKGETISVDHVWDDGRVTVEATCYTEGVMTYYCFYCNEIRTETIPVTEHREGMAIVVTPATCIADGEQIYPCEICHDTLRTELLPAFGHAEGDIVVTKEATCNSEGVQVIQCGNCGKTIRTDSLPATGLHAEVVDAAVAATCTTTGLTEGKHCSVCNTVIAAQKTIPAKGHTEVIDKAVAATCTASGLTEGKHCSVCNTVITAQTTIPATGHAWDTGVITKQPTITEEGVTTFTCTVCGSTRTESIPVIPILRIPGDVNDDGTVDINDALLVLQYEAGWNVSLNTHNADVNADGVVDIADALLILQYCAGENVTLR